MASNLRPLEERSVNHRRELVDRPGGKRWPLHPQFGYPTCGLHFPSAPAVDGQQSRIERGFPAEPRDRARWTQRSSSPLRPCGPSAWDRQCHPALRGTACTRPVNHRDRRTHRAEVCGIHDQDLEDRPAGNPLQVRSRRLRLGLVPACQIDGSQRRRAAPTAARRPCRARVGAGDEERVARQGFQLTASTAAKMSGTSLRVV